MAYKVGKGKPPKRTQFKKGQSGNPDGGRKHNPELKRLKKHLRLEICERIDDLLTGSVADLNKKLKSEDSDILTLAIASSLSKCIKKGDWKTLDSIVKILIGKEIPYKEEPPRRTVIIEKQMI